MKLKRVLIIGGTHGNEWTGVYAVKKYQDHFRKQFPALDLEFIHGNPKAFDLNKRFSEEDLNRAFQFLKEPRETYEHKRAHEIKAEINRSPCFVIDLHTTTSKMGQTIILTHYNKQNCYIADRLSKKMPDCRVIGSPDPQRKYLASQSDYGMMIEVGPIANGVIDAIALEDTLKILEGILQEVQGLPEAPSGVMEFFEEIQDIHYPKDSSNQLSAYIHSGFQGKDFAPINGKYTPFRSFTGEDIVMETTETLYPIFINEAAYYPQQMAFTLCRKRNLNY